MRFAPGSLTRPSDVRLSWGSVAAPSLKGAKAALGMRSAGAHEGASQLDRSATRLLHKQRTIPSHRGNRSPGGHDVVARAATLEFADRTRDTSIADAAAIVMARLA
jgi:hypothetical protein